MLGRMATTVPIHPPAKGGLARARVRRRRPLWRLLTSPIHQRHRLTAQARRRRWLRGLRWAGAAGGLLLVVVLYGWRYGFSPLPEPLGVWPETNDLFWEETANPASNFWQSLRTVAATVPLRPLHHWTQAPRDYEEWRKAVREARRMVLAAPDLRPPRVLRQADADALRMLVTSPDHLRPLRDVVGDAELMPGSEFAMVSARSGFELELADLEVECESLLASWRLEAAVVPAAEFPFFFDERGVRHAFDILAMPTQGFVLDAVRLDAGLGAKLLDELASVTNRLSAIESAFLRLVARDGDQPARQWTPEWGRIRRSFGMAMTLMVRDASRLVEDLWRQGLGQSWGGEPSYRGVAHFRQPFEQLVLALQLWVSRPQDFERMRAASVTRTVAALRAGTLPPRTSRPEWVPGSPSRRSWWRRLLDRPAVWGSIESLPDPYQLDFGRRIWVQYLESCRLTLALRLFRDQHGAWPDGLDELVPAVMSHLPVDPVTGETFRYLRTGNRWRLLASDNKTVLAEGAGLRRARP